MMASDKDLKETGPRVGGEVGSGLWGEAGDS